MSASVNPWNSSDVSVAGMSTDGSDTGRRLESPQGKGRDPRPQPLGLLAAYFFLGALALSPLLWASVPPLVDYPNHLARMAVLAQVGPPELYTNYVADWRLLPNLAMDIVVPPLARILPLEVAGRLFIGITMILLVAGTATLHRVLHGKASFWPLLSFLFIYNFVLYYGFLNYLFSLGLALFSFAAWVASPRWKPSRRIMLFCGIASLLFVLHLFALGVYGLLVASYELGSPVRQRIGARLKNAATGLVQFVPAAFLWVWSIGNGGPGYTAWGDLSSRLLSVLAPVSFSNPPALFDFLLFGFVLLLFYAAARERYVEIVPEMRLPLVTMLIAAAIMPQWASGSWAADWRIPVAIPFIALASTRFHPRRGVAVVVWPTAALVLFCTRVWSTSLAWSDMDQDFHEFRSAISAIPAGARMFTVLSRMPDEATKFPIVPSAIQRRSAAEFSHLDALAVIDRGSFLPSFFVAWTPIRTTARNAGLARTVGATLSPAQLAQFMDPASGTASAMPRNQYGETYCCVDWPHRYDYVFWIDFGRPPMMLPRHLEIWAKGSYFHVYRIVPGSG